MLMIYIGGNLKHSSYLNTVWYFRVLFGGNLHRNGHGFQMGIFLMKFKLVFVGFLWILDEFQLDL